MDQNGIATNAKTKWILAFSIFFCAALGTYNRLFSLLGFAICLCAVLICANEDVLFILVFCVSFANIFKIAPSAQSFFTYILILYVGYQFLRGNGLNNEFCLTLVLLIMFLAGQFLMSVNILRTIKFVVNFLFVYFALRDGTGHERDVFLGYIGGVICSSAIARLNVLPKLSMYIQSKYTAVDSVYRVRFAGMYADPNYYSINVIIALCLVVILYYRKEIKTVTFATLSLILASFALMTYSKSAFAMLSMPVLLFLYSNNKSKRYILQIMCLLGLAVLVGYSLAGKIDFFSVVLQRFQSSENLNELTTGRFGIWKNYMKNLSESFFYFFVGRGFGAKLVGGRAAHNTYIDLLYYLGVIGSFLIIRLLRATAIDVKSIACQRNFLNYSVMIVVLIMYFFLSELFYFDMPFHLLISIMVWNTELHKVDSVEGVSICER